jgi:hypothetical protein
VNKHRICGIGTNHEVVERVLRDFQLPIKWNLTGGRKTSLNLITNLISFGTQYKFCIRKRIPFAGLVKLNPTTHFCLLIKAHH